MGFEESENMVELELFASLANNDALCKLEYDYSGLQIGQIG